MKTLTFKLTMVSAVLLMLAGVTLACKDDTEKKIYPMSFEKESPIDTFFEQYLSNSKCFFIEDNAIKYMLINSMNGLNNQMLCSLDTIPDIDFDTKTLIIGQHRMPQIYYEIVEQYILEKETLLELNLIVRRSEGTYEAFSSMHYWGIYPKLPSKDIFINIIEN
ncbi:MAG: hypothetical protein LBU91_02025 [Bacteroidales bacterium]|jgi:hypothetical protein|nr:hypothetical protein [Bacteroidales bacterium]